MGKSITDLSSVTTVGLDLAKHVFQVHGVDASGRVVVAKAIRRNKLLEFFASLRPCLVGLEASGSAHHWARELIKLGHDARMMPPAYVKPYVRRQKNDASDASAICEAVTRPSMRFVGVRSRENQSALMRHKAKGAVIGMIVDPEAAAAAHAAGEGALLPCGVGAKIGFAGEIPVEARWRVMHVASGDFTGTGPMFGKRQSRTTRQAIKAMLDDEQPVPLKDRTSPERRAMSLVDLGCVKTRKTVK